MLDDSRDCSCVYVERPPDREKYFEAMDVSKTNENNIRARTVSNTMQDLLDAFRKQLFSRRTLMSIEIIQAFGSQMRKLLKNYNRPE